MLLPLKSNSTFENRARMFQYINRVRSINNYSFISHIYLPLFTKVVNIFKCNKYRHPCKGHLVEEYVKKVFTHQISLPALQKYVAALI